MVGTYVPRSVVDTVAARGRPVRIWNGAESRSASKGGFVDLCGVVIHHTADVPPHGDSSWNYATFNTAIGPEYNFGIDRDGKINWLASGGVNSSGRGGALALQTCTVPQAGANYRLPAVCIDIDGVGEPSSFEMLISCVVLTGELLLWQGRQVGDTCAHKEWCGPGTSTPGRKIDPYGPWEPGPWGHDKSWGDRQGKIDQFRSEVWWYLLDPVAYLNNAYGAPPPVTPPVEPPPVTPPPVTPPPAAKWYDQLMTELPVLRRGASGGSVKRMQHLLASTGYMDATNTANYDGQFGGGTEGALNNFKVAAGGGADGVCDSWTWGALMHTIDGIPEIKYGKGGDDVRRMQHLLAAAGFLKESNPANYDGVWGNGTESAKVKFDNAKGLTPSPPSDCGQKSWTRLLKG